MIDDGIQFNFYRDLELAMPEGNILSMNGRGTFYVASFRYFVSHRYL